MTVDNREKLRTYIGQECLQCGLCQAECAFLRKYGDPKEIVASLADPAMKEIAFSCSLCGLCLAVCPQKLDTPALMLALRQEVATGGQRRLRKYQRIRWYESIGVSPLFTWYSLPAGCDSVFFPGCTLQGTRPQATRQLFTLLRRQIPHIGMVLDCCTKPSLDLGDFPRFSLYFNEMYDYLVSAGIKQIFIACPSCYKVFAQYGKNMTIRTVWEAVGSIPGEQAGTPVAVTLHDPCVMRGDDATQEQVRRIVSQSGCTLVEMNHSQGKTICCGEGGSVGNVAPDLADTWGGLLEQEAENRKVVTYCAGCVTQLRKKGLDVAHLLDLYLGPDTTLRGEEEVHRAPRTYWNRLRLKRYLQKNLPGPKNRKRPILKTSCFATYKRTLCSLFRRVAQPR